MTIIELYTQELLSEAEVTREMFSRIPEDRYGWKPHEKSMTIQRLANHIAELPLWAGLILHADELDMAQNPYQPTSYNSKNSLLEFFESAVLDAQKHLREASDDILSQKWTLRNGGQIYSVASKAETLRMSFSQVIHHRAQLGVYLRLLNIPIPGSYGPSADEQVT